jgi:hypothetical protein
MTKEEAWKIIQELKCWNTGQVSHSKAWGGPRTPEDDLLDARRETLAKAWKVVGEDQ